MGLNVVFGEPCSEVTAQGRGVKTCLSFLGSTGGSGEGCFRWAGFGAHIIPSGHSKDITPGRGLADTPALTSLKPRGM